MSTGTASTRCRRLTISACPRMARPVPAMITMAAPLRSTQPAAVWPVTAVSPTTSPAIPMTPLTRVATVAARVNRPTSDRRRSGAVPPPCHSTGSAVDRLVSQVYPTAVPTELATFARPSTTAASAGMPVSARPAVDSTQMAAATTASWRRLGVTRAQRAPTPAAGQNRARLVSGSTMRRPTTIASA